MLCRKTCLSVWSKEIKFMKDSKKIFGLAGIAITTIVTTVISNLMQEITIKKEVREYIDEQNKQTEDKES